MSDFDMKIVGHPDGDWNTLYMNGQWVCHGHMIEANSITAVMDALGFDDVSWDYCELTQEQNDPYDGDKLPDDIKELGLECIVR